MKLIGHQVDVDIISLLLEGSSGIFSSKSSSKKILWNIHIFKSDGGEISSTTNMLINLITYIESSNNS